MKKCFSEEFTEFPTDNPKELGMNANTLAYIYQSQNQHWLQFENPFQVYCLSENSGNPIATLEEIENQVETRGCYAVGILSYEASPVFDSALTVHEDPDFPQLWFALFDRPSRILTPQEFINLHTDVGDPGINWESELTEDEFYEAIARVQNYIRQGDTFQVNYSFRLRSAFTGNPRWALNFLRRSPPAPYSAYLDMGRYIIASASPELFFTLDGSTFTSKPMKGTAPRGKTLGEDRQLAQWLHHSAKNRAENVMIVDMVRNDIGRVATVGSVQVPRLFEVERYATVWQMTSTVTAQTRSPLSQILANIFPCASITGAPKARTMEIIKELEGSPRRIYTGAIGFLSPGRKATFNVAIRTLLIDKHAQQVEYGIGSGIVADSDSQEEYQECYIKSRVLTQPQPPFSLLETLLWTPQAGYFLLSYHLQRLQDSAEYFNIDLNLPQLLQQLQTLAPSLKPSPHKIRVLIDFQGKLTLESYPISPPSPFTPLTVKLAPQPIDSSSIWLYHKTTHRQIYTQASAAVTDCDDVLLWNENHQMTEATIANIVLHWQGKWITPPLSCGLLPGTVRAWLLDRHLIHEHPITLDMITPSSTLYLINSVRGWQRACLKERGNG
ncbi:aminodeoxychorismate synthase component I [Roseofilum capinflatum]|uniref:Aminodeoxychorismate synthase component I n=1 Tax=Roseofilum capinflatum BLCC-M114 TaxID=3022440 RepID=A0ABT7BB46_9CYAN|nr:aminodeoxychorismate synthase component I [Roseofilum capinflatum]MDJ1176395.1 aminodeoxychorismate synthase component I [Roseofilum capinflatum BLCC-M114]